jgi:hypothetical protein
MGSATLMLFIFLESFELSRDNREIIEFLAKPGLALLGVLSSSCCWLGSGWKHGWTARAGIAIQALIITIATEQLGRSLLHGTFAWLQVAGFQV